MAATKINLLPFPPQTTKRTSTKIAEISLEITFSPLSLGKSFKKIRSAVPENGCLEFF